jgi:hypothetical protein
MDITVAWKIHGMGRQVDFIHGIGLGLSRFDMHFSGGLLLGGLRSI